MTKTYIKPETITVKVELQQMIAESLGKSNDPTEEVTNEGDVLSRDFGFNFFEDEDIEEEY